MSKPYTTTNTQMKLLRSRGLQISGSYAKRILEKENYYNLINGYKPLFVDRAYQGQGERYKQGAEFKEIYALFLFDRELRVLFLRYILEIENNVRSVLAHDFSMKYGHDDYLKIDNFDNTPANAGDIAELISILHRDIANQLKKNNAMIRHYIFTYSYVPLWVLVNVITLGVLSKFYTLLKPKDQNDIGRHFSLRSNDMKSYLKNLSLARNWCAHDERFFDKRVKANITSNAVHTKLGIPCSPSGQYSMGQNDIFSIVIIFKQMLPKKDFNKFVYSIKSLFDRLDKSFHTISVDDIRNTMGFPTNWMDIKNV